MTEEPLQIREVHLAAPQALRERRKLKRWADAVYYMLLQDKDKVMVVLRLSEDGQTLEAFYCDKDTRQVETPSIGYIILAHSKGKELALQGTPSFPVRMSRPTITAVFACSRELRTADEVKRLRPASNMPTPTITSYDELTEWAVAEARDGVCFYATRHGQVFQCTSDHNPRGTALILEELYVRAGTPPRIMYLEPGMGPSKRRPSRKRNKNGGTKGLIGPFEHVLSSDRPMTPSEIREYFKLPGRHQSPSRKSTAAQ